VRFFPAIPPFRRNFGHSGKSLPSRECMVVDAVIFEPVSEEEFPANRENYSEISFPKS
jgi:hypothetical protein